MLPVIEKSADLVTGEAADHRVLIWTIRTWMARPPRRRPLSQPINASCPVKKPLRTVIRQRLPGHFRRRRRGHLRRWQAVRYA